MFSASPRLYTSLALIAASLEVRDASRDASRDARDPSAAARPIHVLLLGRAEPPDERRNSRASPLKLRASAMLPWLA